MPATRPRQRTPAPAGTPAAAVRRTGAVPRRAGVRTAPRRTGVRTAPRRTGVRTALRRSSVLVLAAALAWGPQAAALGATGDASGDSPLTALAAPGEDKPLQITVTQLDPRTVTPGSTITITGTVTNTADVAMTDLVMRLQRGPALTSRDELRANDTDPSSSTNGFAPFVDLLADLDAGDTAPFRYQTTADVLGLQDRGVYPLLVNVNGTPDGDVEQRVGQLDTYLPFFPEPSPASTAVAWLWPLVDRPHRGADGRFQDDDLARTVSDGGRLERLVAVAEASPQVPLTLAVDPLLLADLQAMTAGYQLRDGAAGGGGAAAAAWLDRLRALARTRSVIALPYADADVVVLTRAGLDAPAADAVGRGAQVVSATLGVPPDTGLAWPVGGAVTNSAAAVFTAAGAQQFVLGADAVGEPANSRRTPNAVSTVIGSDGTLRALVSDPVIDAIVAEAGQWPTGPRMAEQRYLAELAMVTAEAPSVGRELIIAPPRRWDARVSYALPMLADTAAEPWLQVAAATDLGGPPTDRGALVYPTAAAEQELDPAGTTVLAAGVASVVDFTSMLVVNTPAQQRAARALTAPLDSAVLSAASAYWRRDAGGLLAATRGVVDGVDALRRRVLLIVPTDGTYSLASARASLVFTVQNQLPVPVQVRISVDTSRVSGLATEQIGPQLLTPSGRTLITVPATVERPGEFRVTSTISTPAGGALGDPVRLTVRSTVYGGIAVIITICAGGLLVLLFALRLVRRLRHGPGPRRSAPAPIEQVPLEHPTAEVNPELEQSRAGPRGAGT